LFRILKRLVIGKPLPSHAAGHQRLSNRVALAVFASDALSSTAYATEEILYVLVAAQAAYWWVTLGIAGAILALLAIVVVSYGQTIHTYPSGGGAYIVAKENLGTYPGLVAGAALLVDYILTAAVSVAAGIAAITSAVPSIAHHRVLMGGVVLLVITLLNLRGVKESGLVFSIPTYGFVFVMSAFVLYGLARRPFVSVDYSALPPATLGIGSWMMLRAFSSGCTALTGVEAITNGVPAFRDPAADNAAKTMRWLGIILGALFVGITALTLLYGASPNPGETVISQVARAILGTTAPYFVIQGATAAILILAANTAFADFPRLASLMARDWFLPRQLAMQGDRLAFSNGILLLGLASWLLIALFDGDVHALLPLYAIGVFLSFTLSQLGMVSHWIRERGPGCFRKLAVNLVGAGATGAVLVVITATKFGHGAWVVCVIIPLLVVWFTRVRRHYERAAHQLHVGSTDDSVKALQHTVILPVSGIHRGVIRALEYARSLTQRVRGVTVEIDERATAKLLADWAKVADGVPLDVVKSPYRSLVEPIIQYLDEMERADLQDGKRDDLVTVVIPEFVPKRFWHRFLHNQTALLLGAALSIRPNVVVTTVRVPLDE
jgi:amino acid transporter